MFNKDLNKLQKEDLIKYAGQIRDSDRLKEASKIEYLVCIKKLFKTITFLDKYKDLDNIYIWLYDQRNKFFSTNLNPRKNKDKKSWFNDEDIIRIIEAAFNLRDKTAFSLLATQGTRPAELLGIRKKDIEFISEDEVQIEISGKTGVRPLYIQEDYVINYLKDYETSLPKNQDMLFNITDRRLNDILKEICEKLSINKKATLYKFRHFSITRDRIKGLSAGAMEQKYGWVKGSKRIASYDKSVGSDYRKEIRQIAGKEPLNKEESRFEQVMTKRTEIKNNIQELTQKIKKFEKFINWIESEPDLKKAIEEKVN